MRKLYKLGILSVILVVVLPIPLLMIIAPIYSILIAWAIIIPWIIYGIYKFVKFLLRLRRIDKKFRIEKE